MGFGNDPDKLVVITDGAKQMKLVAFWRNSIPPGASFRIAGQIPVTCGFSPLPEWIQSEQSVVVYGYGAFVVNNIPQSVSSDIQSATKILQVRSWALRILLLMEPSAFNGNRKVTAGPP